MLAVWHACQRYRASVQGKERRREQARRHRDRARQRSALGGPRPKPLPSSRLPGDRSPTTSNSDPPTVTRIMRGPAPSQKFPKNLAACLAIGRGATSCSPPLGGFSRSTFLFSPVSSGVTTSSPAGSSTPARAAVAPGLSAALVADRPSPRRSCRHSLLRMPSPEN